MKRFIRIIGLSVLCAALALPAQADSKYASIVVDARTGMVLEAQQAESLRHPASVTKLMTLYLTFKALKRGTLRMNEAIPVSEFAAAMAPSKLGLVPGTTIRVRDAILGLVTQSANDAAVVLAEALGGSEAAFARQMTQQARHLGMTRTVYHNASGLPDDDQVTTARDQAILARAILFNFPQYYPLFRTERFTYLGLTHENHNHLMQHYPGMDGMKTGYIRASGFNLVASAVRGKTRLIGVVFGGVTARERDRDMAGLLNQTFSWVSKNNAKLSRKKSTPVPVDAPDDELENNAAPVAATTVPPVIATAVSATNPAPKQVAEGDGGSDEEAAEAANRPPAPEPQLIHADVAAVAPTAGASPVAAMTMPTPPAQVQPRANAVVRPTKQAPSLSAGLTMPPPPVATTAPKRNEQWAIQIGAYRNRAGSEHAVQELGLHLPRHLAKARYEIIAVKNDDATMYRARLIGLDEKSARSICGSVTKAGRSCSLIPPAT